MTGTFISHLVTLFTAAIVLWGLISYAQLWVYHNLKVTQKMLCRILSSPVKPAGDDPPDYLIICGHYKGRKVVCRLSQFSVFKLLHYGLRFHIHIEPGIALKSGRHPDESLTQNTRLGTDNKIYYDSMSSTSMKSYLFASRIPDHEFLSVFEELTRAAEIIESKVQEF
jgi:hypothetical protein